MYDECHCRSELEMKPRWRAGVDRTKAPERNVSETTAKCGGVDAAHVQHARICPRGIAKNRAWSLICVGRKKHKKQPENSKSNRKCGLGKQVNVPDRTQKDKPKYRD
jgi:hypothetical protein